jgi:hypothetical protein
MDARSLIDVVLGFVVVEASILAWVGRRVGALRVTAWLPNLAAGFLLALALRQSVGEGTAADWRLALLLALAGVSHALDLASRLRAGDRPAR